MVRLRSYLKHRDHINISQYTQHAPDGHKVVVVWVVVEVVDDVGVVVEVVVVDVDLVLVLAVVVFVVLSDVDTDLLT